MKAQELVGRAQASASFPGPYILLHTISHLVIQCWPALWYIRRVQSGKEYADYGQERFGMLLYTASPDAEGTLVAGSRRYIEDHLSYVQDELSCSNDPICAQPVTGMEQRWLMAPPAMVVR